MLRPHIRPGARFDARLAAGIFATIVLFGPATGARAAVGFQFTPPSAVFCDSLLVDVTVDATVTDLRGFTFVFEFDPAKIVPTSVRRGALLDGAPCSSFLQWINAGAIGDSIYVDGALLGCSVAGPGSILRLRFEGVAQGASPLGCRRSTLRDALNQSIPHTCPDATCTYHCPIAIDEKAWTHLKRVYR